MLAIIDKTKRYAHINTVSLDTAPKKVKGRCKDITFLLYTDSSSLFILCLMTKKDTLPNYVQDWVENCVKTNYLGNYTYGGFINTSTLLIIRDMLDSKFSVLDYQVYENYFLPSLTPEHARALLAAPASRIAIEKLYL